MTGKKSLKHPGKTRHYKKKRWCCNVFYVCGCDMLFNDFKNPGIPPSPGCSLAPVLVAFPETCLREGRNLPTVLAHLQASALDPASAQPVCCKWKGFKLKLCIELASYQKQLN